MDGLLGYVDVRMVEGRELFLFLYWYHQLPFPKNRVSRSNRSEKNILNEMLEELQKPDGLTVQDLKLEPNKGSTKVSYRQGSYRIDSQTPYNYGRCDIANLQYQFTNRKKNCEDTYANTVIKYKPSIVVPADLLNEQGAVEIDNLTYGFRNAEIKSLFQFAMQQSAKHQSINRICWVIISISGEKKIKKVRPPSSKLAIKELNKIRGVPDIFTQQVEEMFKNKGNSFPMQVHAPKSSALRNATARGTGTVLKEISFGGLLVVGFLRAAKISFRKGNYLGALCEVAAGVAYMVPLYGTEISFTITAGLLYRDIAFRKSTPEC